MTTPIDKVVQHLRRTVLLQDAGELTDGQLLECFVSRREEAALEVLVRRHGPMVWGVCGRILHNHHDAEDAFQATFLVLVRKAGSIVPREIVGNWLYGVAHQTALKARATTAKRRVRERQVADMPEPGVTEQDLWRDLQPILDQELSRLPDKYRVAIVLCDLEGKTRKDAARQLRCPEGTLAARLARGRVMLAKRLARHSFAISGGTLAGLLSQPIASACVPISVVSSTIKAVTLVAAGQAAAGVISANAVALAEGVLKTMLLSKLKVATATLLMIAVLGAGAVGLIRQTKAVAQVETPKQVPPKAAAKDENPKKPKEDKDAILGEWQLVELETEGKLFSENGQKDRIAGIRWKFTAEKLLTGEKALLNGDQTYSLDGVKKPKEMDLTPVDGDAKGKVIKAVYSLEGDTLKVCLPLRWDQSRPSALGAKKGNKTQLYTFKREPDEKIKVPQVALPGPVEKEQKVLTPELAIKAFEQNPKKKVTVELKIKSAVMRQNPVFVPQGEEVDYIEFISHDKLYFHLYGKAVTQIKRLGIDPATHFRDRVVRITGMMFANDDPAYKNTPHAIVVERLDDFEVVKTK